MDGQLIVAILAFCLSAVQAFILVIYQVYKFFRKTTEEKKGIFKDKIQYIWNNNYPYYFRTLYAYYKKRGLFDDKSDLNSNSINRQKFLVPVDDIFLNFGEKTQVDNLVLLENIIVNYEEFDKSKLSIPIDNSKFPDKKKTFLENYKNFCAVPLKDKPSYFLKNVNKKDKTEYIVHGEGYNHYIESGLYLEYDLSNYEPDDINKKGSMKLREKLDLLNFSNRYVGIGICTLTLFKNVYNRKTKENKDTYFLIHNRGSNLTEHPSQKSVIPAGTFEPIGKDYTKKSSLDFSNTVYREFVEELFNDDEFTDLGTSELIENNEVIKNLKTASKLYYLGSGIDIINGKLEVLNILVIDVLKWEEKYKKMDSHSLKTSFQTNFEGEIEIKEFRYERLKQYSTDSNFVPCAREIFSILCHLKDRGVYF